MKHRTITDGLFFPEGPIAMPDGTVLVVEIARGTLTRVFPDGRKEIVAETGGGPTGAAIGPDGKCYVCNNGGFKWKVEPNGNRRSMRRRPMVRELPRQPLSHPQLSVRSSRSGISEQRGSSP